MTTATTKPAKQTIKKPAAKKVLKKPVKKQDFKTCVLAPANQPWKLIRDAIADLKKQEATPGVVIKMGEWHYATEDDNGKPVCHQCLAGCTLARRCETNIEKTIAVYTLPVKLREKLYALDHFRTGEVRIALGMLGLGLPLGFYVDESDERTMPEYDAANPQIFHEAMLSLAAELEWAFTRQAKVAKSLA